MNNILFQKELLQTPIRFQKWEQPVKLIDYYTNPDYASFNLLSAIKKYTLGLPGLLKKAIMPKKKALAMPKTDDANALYTLTEDEYLFVKEILPNIVSMSLDNTQGVISLSASMPDPLAAAQLTQTVVDLLQKYITEYKIKKAQDNLTYIQGRLDEAKQVYETTQNELATFMDSNRTLSTARSLARQKQLENEYDMANSIYLELAMQEVQAQQTVKEDTPLLTAIKPVVVPMERDKPSRTLILLGCTLLGFILGCGCVVVFDFFHKNNVNWPKKWE